ncbi:hypothetical protein SH601_13640 [Gracilibacillus sp. S3-1-1]|uniref:Uncharacterized protein n=1 Tax=Gracilibacillus pellucidus TaxID=3095368 RepID=A0ACC6M7S0_9BACI|nr:hypothetical protein [Gracilibacillus sp. S3-1-1]MDX8047031.1 hypothetical protein [Gracilibacillus sp. S3-1-1]
MNNKLALCYILILIGAIGLLRMVLGFTDFSFVKTILFVSGIILLFVATQKQKTQPQYVPSI